MVQIRRHQPQPQYTDFVRCDGRLTRFMANAVHLEEEQFMRELAKFNNEYKQDWFNDALERTNISAAEFVRDGSCREQYVAEVLIYHPEFGVDQARDLLRTVSGSGSRYEHMRGFDVLGIQHLIICFKTAQGM